jgi:hypothetical protein
LHCKQFLLKYASLLLFLFISLTIRAQSDSANAIDTTGIDKAAIHKAPIKKAAIDTAELNKQEQLKTQLLRETQQQINNAADSLREQLAITRRQDLIDGVQKLLAANPNYRFGAPPVSLVIENRRTIHHEGIFYFILSLVLYLALMRFFFPKYMSTMFTLFFRATMRQQQLREQMLQSPLPALLLNIFFVIITGAWLAFMAGRIGFFPDASLLTRFWLGVLIVSTIYLGKFLVLKTFGWISGISQVTNTYIFIVFLTNKMIGIFLLSFLILIAFPDPQIMPGVTILSYIMIAVMILYRFVISFRPVRAEIKLNRLHFFLYLCAFEIAPLLLIYRVLLAYSHSSF